MSWWTIALLALTSARPSVPQYRFVVSEIGNLVYQLDCLAGTAPCAFEELWKKRLGWSSADDEVLATRVRLMGRYKGQVQFDDAGDDGPFMADFPQVLEPRKKLLRAALEARDLDDYQRRLELVMLPQDAAELARQTERFLPRFRAFYREGQPRLARTARQFEAYLARPAIVALLQQAVAFFQVPNPAQQRAEFPLMAIPPEWKGHTSGRQFENQAMMDVTADGTPDFVHFSIAMHEGFHFLYSTAVPENTRKLVAAFARSADPGAATAYSLLNEALAAALSAGLVHKAFESREAWERRSAQPATYYEVPTIDLVAKAMVPWLEERLSHGRSLYEDDFVPEYVALVRKALGAEIDRPANARVIVAALEERAMEPALQIIGNASKAGREQVGSPLDDADLHASFEKHPQQGGYVMVRADHLDRLKGWQKVLGADVADRLAVSAGQPGAFIQAVARPGVARRSIIYVFVGRQPQDFERLARAFVEAPAPFDRLPLHDR